MWFSFLTNILTLLLGVILYLSFKGPLINRYLGLFILWTGISSGIAAFGHLEILPINVQRYLLVLSRILNVLSIFFFAYGSLQSFGYSKNKKIRVLTNGVFALSMIWLIYWNMKLPGAKASFLPVIIYGIIGMVLIGAVSFVMNLKVNKGAHGRVLLGVLLIAVSAVVFKVIPEESGMKPSDMSHVLIALALVFMTSGFKKMKLNEIYK
ncbi:MAG: hypothetical protein COA58_01050 [Bacteroidetes bacterium]|nr:MAG: hypothetical protein COA58_01050 [Bacteroidota bacterium]